MVLRYYMKKARVSTNGHFQLPKSVMNKFDIEKGDNLVFYDREGFEKLEQSEADKFSWMAVAIEKNPENLEKRKEESEHYL